jgi:hypothetical protein
VFAGFVTLSGCGWSTGLSEEVDAGQTPVLTGSPEVCDGLDDDLDGEVDEGFRDELGRYVDDQNCGACGVACVASGAPVVSVACVVIEETPVCAATECVDGYAPSISGNCVPAYDHLCLPCVEHGACGRVAGAACVEIGGSSRCAVDCSVGCPGGYTCREDDGVCVPTGGSCDCEQGQRFELACALHDPSGALCPGQAVCDDGALSACAAADEVCDEVDDDCDGVVDEGFVDPRGVYSVDPHNCGRCGVDCTAEAVGGLDLACGGDPLSPTCVLSCPDALDGLDPGDHVDADRDIATGCECTVTSLADAPGPVGAVAEALDVNCDGADGVVVESIYVATDGDDGAIGSPTAPLRTLGEAMRRASASLLGDQPRRHVFVASGSYAETVELPDGVRLHGGYRRDFLELDPAGFLVEVRAPSTTSAPGGAALVARGAGVTETVVEWITLRGLDALGPSMPAFGVVLDQPGPNLTLRALEIRAGVPGPGTNGSIGVAGRAPAVAPGAGEPPRAALEDAFHACSLGPQNRVIGGPGGQNTCGGAAVNGGSGGQATCPAFASFQPSGQDGRNVGRLAGGFGGAGGQDSQGPITGPACPGASICCGLSDFSVPSDFRGPQTGQNGQDGAHGRGGDGCEDPLGALVASGWTPAPASSGADGGHGSGGGGGGAGGGTQMNWTPTACEFPDGLGGGGGGGGAGGCGGRGGRAGTSGGPSVALVVRASGPGAAMPLLDGVLLRSADGGRGGDGGAGGAGGFGGTGALGGELPRDRRVTPTLAGPFPGARGGSGGNGGSGGGGGGGCGGASVGVWITGAGGALPPGAGSYASDNEFHLGAGGLAGRGGGGAAAGEAGEAGEAIDVVAR